MSSTNYPDIGGQDGIFVPIYIDSSGQQRRMPSDAILDIAGVESPDFTVGGKKVLLAGQSSGDGGTTDLQIAYDNSVAKDGFVTIKMDPNKGLIFSSPDADTGNLAPIFGMDPTQGILGFFKNSTFYNDSTLFYQGVQQLTHLVLSTTGDFTKFTYDPTQFNQVSKAAITILPGMYSVDDENVFPVLMNISGDELTDFKIANSGAVYIRDLTVNTLNGFDINAFALHLPQDYIAPFKHEDEEIEFVDYHQNFDFVPQLTSRISLHYALNTIVDDLSFGITTVYNSVNDLGSRLDDLGGVVAGIQSTIIAGSDLSNRVSSLEIEYTNIQMELQKIDSSNISAFRYNRTTPSQTWTILHNTSTRFIQYTVYDKTGHVVIPDDAFSLDDNTFVISFTAPQDGSAMVTCFGAPITTINDPS
jgi:hypothetical protein